MRKNFSGVEYKIEWIPVRNLAVVWPEAQRKFEESWAKRIADGFDPDLFDPVKVTLPNGNGIYHICEGQHRTRAVEMALGADQKVPCYVAQEADPQRAAQIFLRTNTGRKQVNKVAKFKVAVVANEKIESAIDRIVKHNGYRVEGSHAQDTIAAVEGLKFAYAKGPQTLDTTLRVLRDTWSGDATAVCAPLLKGYSAFICEFVADIDFGRLRDRMSKTTPGKLLIDAKGVRDALHIPTTAAVVHLLLTTYNKGIRKPLKRKGKE